MKKKTVGILLIVTMIIISAAACGKEKTSDDKKESAKTESVKKTDKKSKEDYEPAGVTRKEYQNMTAQDLLDRIEDPENITEEEAIALVSTYAYVDYDEEFEREENITDEAVSTIYDEGGWLPDSEGFIETLITSENSNVRAYGFSIMDSNLTTYETLEKKVEEILEKETDPVVLYMALESFSSCGSDPYFAKFFIKMAEHENPKVREQAAYAIGSPWSKGVEGMAEAIVKLMNDEDEYVRETACSSAGYLADDDLIEPLVEILDDSGQVELHDACIEGLTRMWLDYPFYYNTSEAAYRATLGYLSKTPRTEEVPCWTCISYVSYVDEDEVDEWRTRATYFDPDEICNIMIDILTDSDANWLARNETIEVILKLGDDAQKDKLKSTMTGLNDEDASHLQESYERAVEED